MEENNKIVDEKVCEGPKKEEPPLAEKITKEDISEVKKTQIPLHKILSPDLVTKDQVPMILISTGCKSLILFIPSFEPHSFNAREIIRYS
jgi:hypothetical protein